MGVVGMYGIVSSLYTIRIYRIHFDSCPAMGLVAASRVSFVCYPCDAYEEARVNLLQLIYHHIAMKSIKKCAGPNPAKLMGLL